MLSKRLERAHHILQRVEEALLAGAILLVAVLLVANVFCRTLLGFSLAFTEELSRMAMVAVTFVGLGYAAGRGRHIRMTALFDQLGHRGQKAVMVFSAGATAALMFLLAWYSVSYLQTLVALGSVSPVLQVPYWTVSLLAPLGFVLAGVQYALAVVRNLAEPEVYLSFNRKDEYEEPVPDGL